MQNTLLPDTNWQHITYTMPGELWIVFNANRSLLGKLAALSAKPLLKIAKKKQRLPGIFTALHTFGRNLKWNVHVHLSITLGGLCPEGASFKPLYFPKQQVMSMWRYEIIHLLRSSYDSLELPLSIKQLCPDAKTWNQWLDTHYRKNWMVHFAKSTHSHRHTVKYLGRYIKRPPLALSRLKHYDGQHVVFKYLDHRTGTYQSYECTTEDFIKRFIRHIPDKGFRLIRYYGFLANRVRGTRLPQVYTALGQSEKSIRSIQWPTLSKRSFGIDPLQCLLCQSPMVMTQRCFGLPNYELHLRHKQFALMRSIR